MAARTFCLMTLGFSVFAVVLGLPHRVAAQEHTVTDLGTLGGSFSKAHALNDLGQVVGVSKLSNNFNMRAFLWQDGVMTHLGTLGGLHSYAYGINNETQVVGRSGVGTGFHAFIWQDGQMMDLGTPSGIASAADDINDAGQVTGYKDLLAFVWEDGVWTDLGTLPGFIGSVGFGINAAGEVVGGAISCFFCPAHATHWVEGAIADLGVLPGWDSSGAYAINEVGQIVGASATIIPSILRATLWENANIIDLGAGDGLHSEAFAINNAGLLVGYWGTSEFFLDHYATLWQDGVMFDLNDLIPADSGWQLSEAQDINESGQICGFGYNPDGLLRGFVLDPCSPADFDCNGGVGAFDLAVLLGNWGPCAEPCTPGDAETCPADFDHDCQVTAADLAQLLGSWGP